MPRSRFGTDGVRGVVGRDLTVELVERLGLAATRWIGGGRVLVGRDTRGSGPALEAAFARGVVAGGGEAVLAGVLPTAAVALAALDLGVVISASHNPPEYNGVKFFDGEGAKLSDAAEEELERLLDDAPPAQGPPGRVGRVEGAPQRYAAHILERFGTDLGGLRLAVDCANGALSGIAPALLRQLGAEVTTIGDAPDGTNINVGCGATDLALLSETVRRGGFDLGVAFDGDGDRLLAVDESGATIDGDAILALLVLGLPGIDAVAVTTMTNLGFHRLMAEHRIRVFTTDVGDRYVLEALRREGAVLGGEQSGHVIYLNGHVTGDGLAAALLLCAVLRGRPASAAAADMRRLPQAQRSVPVRSRTLTPSILAEVERVNLELGSEGRVLVRPSGTEPVVRVLAEAGTAEAAEALSGRMSSIVSRELG